MKAGAPKDTRAPAFIWICILLSWAGCASPAAVRERSHPAPSHEVAPPEAAAPIVASVVPSGSRLFEFHSGFWASLHHFLYVQARARRGEPDSRREAVAGAPDDVSGLAGIDTSSREAWESAIQFYQSGLAARDLISEENLVRWTDVIAFQENAATISPFALPSDVDAALRAAAPIYRRVWWPRHDKANRDWIAAIDPLLRRYETPLAQAIARAYHQGWEGRVYRVDVCPYASWAGAYTTGAPPRITIGSLAPGNEGTHGVEILFHENMHVMEDAVVSEILRHAKAQHKKVPPLLSHAFIYYTAGEMARRVIPGHVPYAEAFGIWDRDPWPAFKRALDAHWLPYLDGRATFDEAIREVVGALSE